MTDLETRSDLGPLEPNQAGMELPERPVFDTVEEERLHRKQRLAAGLRVLGRLRLAEGLAGHVTVRDPERPDHFWVNPFGKNFKHMTVSDLICVDPTGQVVIGDRPVNTAAFVIHGAIHDARPDVQAAAHCHSMHGRTFSSLGRQLRMITQDHTAFYQDVALHAEDNGAPVLDREAGHRLAASLGGCKVMIHQNHGLISTGGSVDAAIWNFVALERCCQSQLLAEAAGEPVEVSPELCRQGHDVQGSDYASWLSFQPWWDELMREEPDFLD
ncbi:MAG: class II aldolase/adducin family protein [Actinomycetota bacterium]